MGSVMTLRGIYPILATCFHPNGDIDYDSQKRLIDFCIESGVHGLVTLANASEGHLLSDTEKHDLLSFNIETVSGRVPVIATINHPAAHVASKFAAFAEKQGASAVMALPPFFGRWRSGPAEIVQHFQTINDAVTIPIVLQDHVLSDISLPVDFLTDMATRLDRLLYFKLEAGNIIHKSRKLLESASEHIDGVFGGNSGIFLPEEHEAGCCGAMPACYMPDVFCKTWDLLETDQLDEAVDYFTPYSRLAAYENANANRCVWKELLVQRGIISSGTVRDPKPGFADEWQINQLIQVSKRVGLI
ncbi:MAG: 2-keto-3-deoxy-L-arabinonate dehydratase [Candidatus Latescibacterota bacterium]|jgi:2-keto-3-deoxy-L-arabinonate dehydratase